MKHRNSKLLILALLLSASGFSQESNQNDDGGQQIVNKVINYNDRPLNVEGYDDEPEVVDSELNFINNELKKQKNQIYLNKEKTKKYKNLQDTTEKLVDTTKDYVVERKSSEAQIKKYNKQIKCLLDENALDPDCQTEKPQAPVAKQVVQPVVIQQAAPTPAPVVVEKSVSDYESSSFIDSLKVLPEVGFRVYSNGEFYQQIDSTPLLGIRVESEINRRVALGLGFNYHSNTFAEDFYNDFAPNYYGNYNYNYQGSFYDGLGGRAVELKSFGLDMYGKFYLFNSTRLRPFIGAGVGVNRLSMEYDQNDYFNGGAFVFGNESYSTFAITGNLKGGAEFSFTKNVGFFLEGNFNKGLTTFGGSDLNIGFLDEGILQQLADDFANSNSFGVNAGVTVTF